MTKNHPHDYAKSLIIIGLKQIEPLLDGLAHGAKFLLITLGQSC